ncbi:MAG: OmpA family protein [Alphaproteobacteria bacterium]
MKFKFLLVVLLSLTIAACSGKKVDEADDLAADLDALNAQGTSAFEGLPGTLPGIATDPTPQIASLPQSIISAPITPTPNFTLGTQEALRADAGDRIFFQTNSSQLDGRAQAILSGVAGWMNQNPSRTLTIEGHADERGTREYNLALGESRATTVKNFLSSQGVSTSRLNSVSFGKERPASAGSNPRAWALNRRSVFIVR